MWTILTDAGRKALRTFDDVPPEHPVWTRSPWEVFLHLPKSSGTGSITSARTP